MEEKNTHTIWSSSQNLLTSVYINTAWLTGAEMQEQNKQRQQSEYMKRGETHLTLAYFAMWFEKFYSAKVDNCW